MGLNLKFIYMKNNTNPIDRIKLMMSYNNEKT